MKAHPASSVGKSGRDHVCSRIVLAACAAAAAGGCSMHNSSKPKIPWATAVHVRPLTPAKAAPDAAADAEPLPDLKIEFPAEPIHSLVVHNGPARPHVAASAPSAGGNNETAAKPEQPSITPQLPPAEAQSLQQQMDNSVSAAERNLATAHGKKLNPAQLDLVSKVKSFLADSRKAAQEGDLRRADNLAKKAQVLSEELAASL